MALTTTHKYATHTWLMILKAPNPVARRTARVPLNAVWAAQQHRPTGRDGLPRVPNLKGRDIALQIARPEGPPLLRGSDGAARDYYLLFCNLAMALVLLTGCASASPKASALGQGGAATPPYRGRADLPVRHAQIEQAQVKQRLAEIFHAAETKDLPRLDSYHWYGPHFTKFAGTGQRLDAAAAREGEHKGLSALVGLKLRTEDLQVDVFNDAAVATFTMVATIQSGAEPITKRERGTLVFVKHEGSWRLVHEHFSAAE